MLFRSERNPRKNRFRASRTVPGLNSLLPVLRAMTHHGTQLVYVIQHELGPVKIGIAENPENRLRELQTSCPFELKLRNTRNPVDAQEVESFLHDHFRDYHLRGEWFDLPPQHRDFEIPTKIHSTGRPNIAVPRGGNRSLTAEWGEALDRLYRSLKSSKPPSGQIRELRSTWREYGSRYLNDQEETDSGTDMPDDVSGVSEDISRGEVRCSRCGHHYDHTRNSCPNCRGSSSTDSENIW